MGKILDSLFNNNLTVRCCSTAFLCPSFTFVYLVHHYRTSLYYSTYQYHYLVLSNCQLDLTSDLDLDQYVAEHQFTGIGAAVGVTQLAVVCLQLMN